MQFTNIVPEKFIKILFPLVIAIALVLRFWQLGEVPISPDWDEVSLGYNAYCILHTGRDEFNRWFPVVMESTGDYKPALYAYLAVPSIAVFGLTAFATRLPAAFIGILAVIAAYFLVYEFFKRKDLALLTSFFLAISSFHIQFSRVAIESGVGDAFNLFVILFFLKGLKKPWYLYLSFLFAALNLYVYQSEKAYTPLLVLLLLAIYWRQFWQVSKKVIVSSLGLGLFVALPMLFFILSNHNALTRLQSVNIFTQSSDILSSNVTEELRDRQNHDILGELIDNRRFAFLKQAVDNYFWHYDLNWLFITGDKTDRHQPPGMGHLYLWDLIFFFIGIYFVFFAKIDIKTKLILFGWFLLSPVPAAITTIVPHAVRTLNFLPTFQIFIAVGFLATIHWLRIHLKDKRIFITSICLIVGLLLWNVVYYLDQYFVQFNYFTSQDWQYGYTQLIPYIQQNEGKYKKIYVSNQIPLDQSYIFFLFYLKYPPQLYQPIEEKIGHYTDDHAFGKFVFTRLSYAKIVSSDKDTLFIFGYYDISATMKVVKVINFLDGTPAIKIVEGGKAQ